MVILCVSCFKIMTNNYFHHHLIQHKLLFKLCKVSATGSFLKHHENGTSLSLCSRIYSLEIPTRIVQ